MERWIEEYAGAAPDGFPYSRYEHERCGEKSESAYPYCPWCGKRVTHIKILRNGFEEFSTKHFKERGFIVE